MVTPKYRPASPRTTLRTPELASWGSNGASESTRSARQGLSRLPAEGRRTSPPTSPRAWALGPLPAAAFHAARAQVRETLQNSEPGPPVHAGTPAGARAGRAHGPSRRLGPAPARRPRGSPGGPESRGTPELHLSPGKLGGAGPGGEVPAARARQLPLGARRCPRQSLQQHSPMATAARAPLPPAQPALNLRPAASGALESARGARSAAPAAFIWARGAAPRLRLPAPSPRPVTLRGARPPTQLPPGGAPARATLSPSPPAPEDPGALGPGRLRTSAGPLGSGIPAVPL